MTDADQLREVKGRQVRKGEKAIEIFGFAQKTVRDTGDQTADITDEAERVVTYFPVLSVFDINQTEPIDSANDPLAHAEARLNVDDPDGITEAATGCLTSRGWTVDHRRIQGADAAARSGHVILHADEPPEEYQQHRGIEETEAESVAYAVAGLLRPDTTPTSISSLQAGRTATRRPSRTPRHASGSPLGH